MARIRPSTAALSAGATRASSRSAEGDAGAAQGNHAAKRVGGEQAEEAEAEEEKEENHHCHDGFGLLQGASDIVQHGAEG